ncbi:glycosyl hydrolase family 95 catalytic domain-containing protein [Pseudoalteromonas sp. ZZD1]|uniref:glycosyl hydrolase family 95 catalytic domain-containing protein n=1 Tax=Pseudoalteromonas sp. ZZD1 TaxID=3139395 RepID=UPI003BA8B68A
MKTLKTVQLKSVGFALGTLLLVSCSSGSEEVAAGGLAKPEVAVNIDYKSFLSQQDLIWDRIPNKWTVAPYTGNGNIGFLFYQAENEAKNVISIHTGRHDYYDHRLPYKGEEMLWIYRGRLPLGHFNLTSKGDIENVDLRLGLYDAELTGEITTSLGSYAIKGLTHSEEDVIYFETDAKNGESIKITWHPDEPYPPVKGFFDRGRGPKSALWDRMRNAPMPMPPKATLFQEGNMNFSFQPLYKHRGETTVGWEIEGKESGKQYLSASVHHSFPEKNSHEKVKANLAAARDLFAKNEFFKTHQAWWHNYYPQSFLTIGEPEKEAFYWIQMYKLASASRGDGPILDLMGPWYNDTFWPMVWGDLNVQLIYWTHLTANRMELGESLVNNIDKYHDNLTGNVPKHWKDSAAVGALFPQDMVSTNGGKVPDMLAWLLHDYWLHYTYLGDKQKLRDGLFPILRKTGNSYLNYLKDNALVSDDGTIHIKHSWSPEYKPGRGQDINFTIGLLRWTFETLIELDEANNINDPLFSEWKRVLDNLVPFQVDENGLRIGKYIPFDKPHRHYSHLLPIYPLAQLNVDNEKDAKLARTSVDHWLDVTMHSKKKAGAMKVTGYTATGASSIYATLGDGEKAYEFLDFFINHKNVSPTTMYAEVKTQPVIESPLSYATSVHDMLLQSWGGKVRVFPAVPGHWQDIAFHQLRTQGAFLVTAKKSEGKTQFVELQSLVGTPLVISPDIANPIIYIDGQLADPALLKKAQNGFLHIELAKGQRVLLMSPHISQRDLFINSQDIEKSKQNLFGLSEKTTRLPSHTFYYGE